MAMRSFRPLSFTCLLLAVALSAPTFPFTQAQERELPVIAIDFFGYGSMDLSQIRSHLPVHVGQAFPSFAEERSQSPKIRDVILQITGKPVTSLSNVQVDDGYLVYIGLPGTTMRKFPAEAAPTGPVRLPDDAMALYQQKMTLLPKAIAAGATEDDTKGYALSSFPLLRQTELSMRAYVLQHEALVVDVMTTSSDENGRAAAADMLGYADVSALQIRSLVQACYDPDSLVRNNAIRAIGAMVSARPDLGGQIPLSPFLQMLRSESWTDRNKAGWVLDSLTKSRDPKVLSALRSQALDPLVEMAEWHDYGHAGSFRLILGRIAGIDEATLEHAAQRYDKVDWIVAAARGKT